MVSSLILLSACTYQFINTLILSIFRYVTSADLNLNGIYYGCNGRAKITTSDGITFDFKESKKSTWDCDVSYGIFHEIFYIKQ